MCKHSFDSTKRSICDTEHGLRSKATIAVFPISVLGDEMTNLFPCLFVFAAATETMSGNYSQDTRIWIVI